MPDNNGIYLKLTVSIDDHCKELFKSYQNLKLKYHNVNHTQLVVNRAAEIATYYELTEQDLFILLAAAWFHDTGHLQHSVKGHEIKSVQLMFNFLSNQDVGLKLLRKISNCILATKYPGNPQALTEMILCDADLYHLGTDEFFITNELVKEEIEMRQNIKIPDWNETSLVFLKNHSYFTGYCKNLLAAGKNHNIEQLKKMIQHK